MLLTALFHLTLFFTLSPLFINCCGGEEDEKKSTKPKDSKDSKKAKTKKPEKPLEKRPPPRRRPVPRARTSTTKLATPTTDTTGTTGTTGTTMATGGPVVTTPPPEVPLVPMASTEILKTAQLSQEFLAPMPAPPVLAAPPPPPPPPPQPVEPSTEPDEDLCRCRDYMPDTLKEVQYLFDLLEN